MVDVNNMKLWLRVDGNEEDQLITDLIDAAKNYITNATGYNFSSENKLADMAIRVLVTHWYENRQSVLIGSISKELEYSLESILMQLRYCRDVDAPSIPTGLVASAGDGRVDLSWEQNTEGDLAGYHVYQGGSRITANPVADASYQATGLTNGLTYTFQVSAIDQNGNESELSSAVTATPTA